MNNLVKPNFETHDVLEGHFDSHYPQKAHIYFRHYVPKKIKFGTCSRYHIIFLHGMIEYHKRHEEFFKYLIDTLGCDVSISTMDLLGHGMSGGPRAYIDDFKTYSEDTLDFLSICSKRFYQKKKPFTVYISHSLGGLVTIKTITDPEINIPLKIDCMIFSNPCIAPKVEIGKSFVKFFDYLPEAMAKIHVPLIYDAYDLTSDEARALDFIHDHLISKSITLKLGVETLKACKGLSALSYFFTTPSLFILSGDDRVVDSEKTRLFITGMDKSLVQVKYYPNMRHEILNETCRFDAFQVIISYIKQMETQNV